MKTIVSTALILIIVSITACSGQKCSFSWLRVDTPPTDTRIYVAKKIITMEPLMPSVSSVAISNGRILALGSLAEVVRQLGDQPYEVDRTFSDKVLLPGFIDNHMHPSMAAVLLPMKFITPFDWNLSGQTTTGVQSEAAYFEQLVKAEEKLTDPAEWLLTWGFHHYFHGEMSREKLDTISQTRPIIVWHRSFHEVFANTAALQQMGISSSEVAQNPHVNYERGHFFESALPVAISGLAFKILSPDWIGSGMERVRRNVHQGGITTIADMATGVFNLEMEWPYMKAVLDDEKTPFRTYLVPLVTAFGNKPGDAAGLSAIKALPERNTDKLQFVKQIKLLADGAFYSLLMQMQPPGYLDGHHGEWIMEPELLEQVAKTFWDEDYQLHIHTNGDEGTRVVLDMLERLQTAAPKDDHRTTLHHLGYSTEQQSARLAELNALVSANPYYLYTLSDKYSEIGLGPERAADIFRGASLIKHGVPLSLHSDFTMAPAEPLTLAWVAINRLTAKGNEKSPEQKLTLDQALRAITIDAAYAIRKEDEIGSIKVGKYADFAVLEKDPYSVAVRELNTIPIWGTVFQGQLYPL